MVFSIRYSEFAILNSLNIVDASTRNAIVAGWRWWAVGLDRACCLIVLWAGLLVNGGCNGQGGVGNSNYDLPAARPAVVEPDDIPPELAEAVESGEGKWLGVERVGEGAEGGWATGLFISSANEIVIETGDVVQFVMHLERMEIDWTRRVVLKIDGASFELTRKHYPTIRLRRSTGGGWNVAGNKPPS